MSLLFHSAAYFSSSADIPVVPPKSYAFPPIFRRSPDIPMRFPGIFCVPPKSYSFGRDFCIPPNSYAFGREIQSVPRYSYRCRELLRSPESFAFAAVIQAFPRSSYAFGRGNSDSRSRPNPIRFPRNMSIPAESPKRFVPDIRRVPSCQLAATFLSIQSAADIASRPRLTPFVLGILSLQLRFDSRIVLAPEIGQIGRYLNRTHARRKDVNARDTRPIAMAGVCETPNNSCILREIYGGASRS